MFFPSSCSKQKGRRTLNQQSRDSPRSQVTNFFIKRDGQVVLRRGSREGNKGYPKCVIEARVNHPAPCNDGIQPRETKEFFNFKGWLCTMPPEEEVIHLKLDGNVVPDFAEEQHPSNLHRADASHKEALIAQFEGDFSPVIPRKDEGDPDGAQLGGGGSGLHALEVGIEEMKEGRKEEEKKRKGEVEYLFEMPGNKQVKKGKIKRNRRGGRGKGKIKKGKNKKNK